MMERLPHRIRGREGFTLVELMIVIIIIGVLAGIAIPRFIRTAEKARGEEAITNLRLIFAGQRMYRLDNNIYSANLVTGDPPETQGGLAPDYIEDMTTEARQKYFEFFLVRPDYDHFTATATRTGGPEPYNGGTININQDEIIWGADGWPWEYDGPP